MTPEPAPEITNPPPEKSFTGRPAETGEIRPDGKPGFLRRLAHVGQWFDRDLDLKGRDTSDWNIYYYYFRQVAQHRALVKLKYMKWIALVFQLYFLSMLAFAVIRTVLLIEAARVQGQEIQTIGNLFFTFIAMLGVSANIYILPFMLFLPVFMVAPAFKLRGATRGLMTSRAKEPPLLAHLVQYTTHSGLVQGALQSMLYTWKRLILLLSPCIVVSILLLAGFIAIDQSERAFRFAVAAPVGTVLFVVSASLFFLFQPFCYRLDSLMVAICVGIETALLLGSIVIGSADDTILPMAGYVVTCLFAIVYFPLAAADTAELGLGKSSSKRIRILLYATALVFLAVMIATGSVPGLEFRAMKNLFGTRGARHMTEIVSIFITWGHFICVCGLLITSVSVTSPLAERRLLTRPKESFLRKLFDPASPLSLLPVIALELLSLATMISMLAGLVGSLQPFANPGDIEKLALYSWGGRARNAWTAIHFGLALTYARQRRKPEMKPPWTFNVAFNMTTLVSYVAIELLFALITAGRGNTAPVSIILYIVSLIVLFTSFGLLKSSKSTFKVEDPQAGQEQDKEEAS